MSNNETLAWNSPPAWFVEYTKKFEEHTNKFEGHAEGVIELRGVIETEFAVLNERITIIESRLDAQEDVSESNTAEIADLRKICNAVNDRLERGLEAFGSASAWAPPVDECEVLVTGIPQAVQLSEEQILDKIFVALGLISFSRFVTYIRPWIQRGPPGS
ncbi:hypothetical protein TKK_0012760 [Trichogramma kaykai]